MSTFSAALYVARGRSVQGSLKVNEDVLSWTPIESASRASPVSLPPDSVIAARFLSSPGILAHDVELAAASPLITDTPSSTLGVCCVTRHPATPAKSSFTPITLCFSDGPDAATACRRQILAAAFPTTASLPPRRSILVLLNPFGGIKKASMVWTRTTRPMLALAGIEYALHETSHAGHASEIVKRVFDPSQPSHPDAIAVIGGDGMVHEAINGLPFQLLPTLPIVHVPAGTANALALNLTTPTPLLATFVLINGRAAPIDLMRVSCLLSPNTTYIGHLMLCWGLIADIDVESERFRWAGQARMDIGLLARLLKLRRYRGTIHYLPVDECSDDAPSISQPPPVPTTTATNTVTSTTTTCPPGWHTWSGTLLHFIATLLPRIAPTTLITPHASPIDARLHIVLVPDTSLASLLRILVASTADDAGTYLSLPGVQYHQVKAVILHPQGRVVQASSDSSPPPPGILDLDGESIPCGPVKIEVLPSAGCVIYPRWFPI